ncbi:MAG: VWA domain-containing protein [Acidobacteria bacterium]|nr:VWA domain-containing protein [Acidobacteriota bacterium]
MQRREFLAAAVVSLCALPVPCATRVVGAQQPATAVTRTVFVTAVDSKGVPVSGLTAADFAVKEDGQTRPVVAAGPTDAPLVVALLIDDSGLGLQSIREGAAAFVTRLRGVAQIALITTGGRNVALVDFTTDTNLLLSAINRIYARNVSGAYLTDGILEVARVFGQREAERPVIVSMGVEGNDFSEARPADVIAALQRTRTQLYLVRIGTMAFGQSNPAAANRGESLADELTRFNAILGQAPPRTGGRIEQLSSHVGIPVRMEAIAAELASQYEVTYTTLQPNGTDLRFEVSTSRRDVRVRAPQRVGPPRN